MSESNVIVEWKNGAPFVTHSKWTPANQATGIESRVCIDIATRQQVGLKKYGMTLEENPAGRVGRLRHAYEEALDLAVYLKWELEKSEAGR